VVNDGIRLLLFKHRQKRLVSNVEFVEDGGGMDVVAEPRRQVIHHHDVVSQLEQARLDVRSDEAGTTGNENLHNAPQ